jgi:hypothetical protein
MTATQTRPTTSTPNDRSTDGRFAKGNRFGPGNPFYRKQAEFRRAVLELFTPEDVMSLLRVMLALGRNGDVAAAKVFLEYVVGKPHKAPDPDRADHHEWQLSAEAPRLADVTGLLDHGVPADMANDATRDAVPHLAAARLDSVFDTLNGVPPAASSPCHAPAEQAAAVPEEQATAPPDGQRKREALRLLTAMLRASVANGVNGKAREEHRQIFDRLTGDNGAGRTVPTADNGHRPTVATVDNGLGIGQATWPAVPTAPDVPAGLHSS